HSCVSAIPTGVDKDYELVFDRANSLTAALAYSRAQWSACKATEASARGTEVCCAMVASMTAGISRKEITPSRNACTATSLAAFNTAGIVPPLRAASKARRRHGKRSGSGG